MRLFAWSTVLRALGVVGLIAFGYEWGTLRSSCPHNAAVLSLPSRVPVPRGLPSQSSPGSRYLPDAPWAQCWPSADTCHAYGLCDMPNPFTPKIDSQTLALCGQLSTSNQQDKVLQLYHVSKCGGTTINTLFKRVEDNGAGGLTDKGMRLLRHERENFWDPEYHGGVRPNSSFIIGTVRNPFEYYVSFWSMFTLSKMKGTNDCLRGSAINAGRAELFDNRGRSNVTQFQAWLHFLFVESCDPCRLTMWRVFQSLYIGQPGKCPSYDRMVRLERFYPSLVAALQDYERYSPNTVNWDVVKKWEADRKNTIRDGPVCPYHCYYDAHTRALVELHDAPLLEHFGYSFQETADRHGGAEACRASPCNMDV
eukprot:m.36650 g.36650  ORF g.36650 m.36650 type:complete len:366 (+) comp5429_c0_seq1:303-1400(+)